MTTTTTAATGRPKNPLWPVLVAPLAAGIYYLAVKLAFGQSIISVMGRTDFFETPHWGSNWTFRAAAEIFSIGAGTFIAASLAPGRERAAAITGGCAISLGFVLKLWLALAHSGSMLEPWYQFAIDIVAVLVAPAVGVYVAETAEEMHRDSPKGVGGVNRLHFLWLWIIVYFYALGLITPVARIYGMGEPNFFKTIVTLIINGIPAAALAIPAYYGMAFLAGYHGDKMHPAGRNMVGVLVLVFGFSVGAIVQFVWYWAFDKIIGVVFG